MDHDTLLQKLETWNAVEDYIQQCPLASPRHEAVAAALKGLRDGREELEATIRTKYPAEFEWYHFLSRAKHAAQKNISIPLFLILRTSQLKREALAYLCRQAKSLRNNQQQNWLEDFKVLLQVDNDFHSQEEFFLFLEFLRQLGGPDMEIDFFQKPCTVYLLSFTEPDLTALSPSTATTCHYMWNFRPDGTEYPYLGCLLEAPTTKVRSMFCGSLNFNRNTSGNFTALMPMVLAHIHRPWLEELVLENPRFDLVDLPALVTALSPCTSLRVFKLINADMNFKNSMQPLEVLMEEHHNSLHTLCITLSGNYGGPDFGENIRERWSPFTKQFLNILMDLSSTAFPRNKLTDLILPLHDFHMESALPLMKHFAHEQSRLQYLQLGARTKIKMTTGTRKEGDGVKGVILDVDPGDNQYVDEDMQDIVDIVVNIGNLTQLKVPEIPSSAHELFLSSTNCAISQLSIDTSLDEEDFEYLSNSLRNYAGLVKLDLTLEISQEVQHWCPQSHLEDVTLHFFDYTPSIQLLATLLGEQRMLKHLNAFFEGFYPVEEQVEYFSPFADGLKHHPYLETLVLEFHHRRYEAPSDFLIVLLDAMKENQALKTLHIGGQNDVGLHVAPFLPKLQFLENFFFPTWEIETDSSREGYEQFVIPFLKQNTSICTTGIGHRCFFDSPGHSATNGILTRNQLLRHVRDIAPDLVGTEGCGAPALTSLEGQGSLACKLWPFILEKLGSNNGEGSPVFALLQKETEMFSKLFPRKCKPGKPSPDASTNLRSNGIHKLWV